MKLPAELNLALSVRVWPLLVRLELDGASANEPTADTAVSDRPIDLADTYGIRPRPRAQTAP